MFDFHSHILPGIDNGSRSVEESLSMLRESAQQGITAIAATSHFYADENSPREFLRRREEAIHRLMPHVTDDMPKIAIGAEVHYFEGIKVCDDLDYLKMYGTSILLLEMPFETWSPRMVDNILELNSRNDTTVLLAHIERYWDDQSSKTWKLLYSEGVKMQVNARFFVNRKTQKKALKMLKKGQIYAIGSDCHNMETRPPMVGHAVNEIKKHLGQDAINTLIRSQNGLLRL